MCTLDVCLRVYPGIGAHDAETKDHPYVSFLIILHLISLRQNLSVKLELIHLA